MINAVSSSMQSSEFGLTDYWRMFKARGIKLPLNYFLQAHAFDLIHGTDTHKSAVNEEYLSSAKEVNFYTPYRCSWTKEIRIAFDVLREKFGDAFENYSFIDIGCGKGKAVLSWALFLKKSGLKQRLVGLDFYDPFIQVANDNQRILGLFDDISFTCGDAMEFDYAGLGSKVIAYMYNPFDKGILRNVLAKLSKADAVIIYNNPVHANEIRAAGYKPIWKKNGWHPNTHTMIFQKPFC